MRKIGRNDPCPCGSGKKFKNCHLGKEDEIFEQDMNEISFEMSRKITSLPPVQYGRSQEISDALDMKELTGTTRGIRFIDLKEYKDLDPLGRTASADGKDVQGGVLVNILKTAKSDPNHIYIAISPKISDSVLLHQMAHALDHLGGSKLMTGLAKPLSFDLGVPTDHLEHPQEFGYWLDYLQKKFDVQLDADDTIISFLYKNGMLISGEDIERQNQFVLKSKSEGMLKFLGEHSAEIDALICELPGYIGSRTGKA
jgi:hypothetical protein